MSNYVGQVRGMSDEQLQTLSMALDAELELREERRTTRASQRSTFLCDRVRGPRMASRPSHDLCEAA